MNEFNGYNPFEFNQSGPGIPPVVFGYQPQMFGTGGMQRVVPPSPFVNLIGPQYDNLMQSMLPMFGQMLNPGGVPSNPFQSTGWGNMGYMMQDAQLRDATMRASQYSAQLAGASGMRMTAALNAMRTAGIINISGEDAKRYGSQAGHLFRGDSIESAMLLGFVPPEISSAINPMLGINNTSTALLRRYSTNPALISGYMDAFIESSGYSPSTGMFDNPHKSYGLSARQQAGLLQQMSSLGFIGFDERALTSQAVLSDPTTAALAGRYQMNRQLQSFSGIKPVAGLAQAIFGIEDPKALLSVIQDASGGGLGQMSPQEMGTRVAALKNLSESAGVAVEAIVGFIKTATNIAQRAGLSQTTASGLAFSSLHLSDVINKDHMNRLGGVVTPGLAQDNDTVARELLTRGLSAQGSVMANQTAIAMQYLKGLASNGDVQGYINGIGDKNQQSILQAVLNVNNGTATGADINVLRSPNGLANTLATLTGQNSADVRAQLQSKELGQQALALNPTIVQSVAGLNVIEKAMRLNTNLLTPMGIHASNEDAARLFANIASVGTMSAEQRNVILADLKANAADLYSGLLQKYGSDDAIGNNLRTVAARMNGAVTSAQGKEFLYGNAKGSLERAMADAAADFAMNASVGGLPAIDKLLTSLKADASLPENMAAIFGQVGRKEQLDAISGYEGSDGIVSLMANGSPARLAAGAQRIAMLAYNKDEAQQKDMISKLTSVQGTAVEKENQIRSIIKDAAQDTVSGISKSDLEAGAKKISEITDAIAKDAAKPESQKTFGKALDDFGSGMLTALLNTMTNRTFKVQVQGPALLQSQESMD